MQLIDRNNLFFELRPESLEDLWVLSQFISENDIIEATTERKVKVGSENNPKQVKKLIFVKLKVNKVSYESEILRINGEIINETEFTSVGSSHTLNFSINDNVKVTKNELLNYQKKFLEDSLESKKNQNLLILLDKDDMIVFEFGSFSYKILFNKKGLGSKKYTNQDINESEEKYLILEPFIKKDYSSIVFAGPGHFKEELSKYVLNKLGLKSVIFQFSEVSEESIQKLIDEINIKGLLDETQLSKESSVMSKVLENISKGLKVEYGVDNVFLASNEGRVENLIISTKLIDKFRDENKYNELNDIIRLVEGMNASLTIIQSNNEPGKVLDGLGGIAALLRY